MFNRYIFMIFSFVIIMSGCNDRSSRTEDLITDPSLLSCFDSTIDIQEINSTIEFYCSDIDLSNAEIYQLSKLSNLRRLTLINTSLNKLDFLSSMENLEYFNFKGNYKNGLNYESPPLILTPLIKNTNLRFLNLSDNYISDFSALSGLVMLEELHINRVYGDALASENTANTSFNGYNLDVGPISFNGLESLINLKTLEISNNYIYVNEYYPMTYDFLLSLNKLEKLKINGSFMNDYDSPISSSVKILSNLKSLKYLEIKNNAYNHFGEKVSSFNSVDFLLGLDEINYLDLSNNIIFNPVAISSLGNLNSLNLSGNVFDSNAVLYGGAESTNSIGNLSFLSNLNKLTDLRLAETAINNSDINYLSLLIKLKYLDLRFNGITDISPISHISIEELYY